MIYLLCQPRNCFQKQDSHSRLIRNKRVKYLYVFEYERISIQVSPADAGARNIKINQTGFQQPAQISDENLFDFR